MVLFIFLLQILENVALARSQEIYHLIIKTMYFLPGLVAVFYALDRKLTANYIRNTPTSKIRSVAVGLAEVTGTILPHKELRTPYSRIGCVYYRYTVESLHHHSAKGMQQEVWKVIQSGEEKEAFWLSDETGKIAIDPKAAEFRITSTQEYILPPGTTFETMGSGTYFSDTFGMMEGTKRIREEFLESNSTAYVLGTAVINRRAPGLFIKKGILRPVFIISNKAEKEVVREFFWHTCAGILYAVTFFSLGISYFSKSF